MRRLSKSAALDLAGALSIPALIADQRGVVTHHNSCPCQIPVGKNIFLNGEFLPRQSGIMTRRYDSDQSTRFYVRQSGTHTLAIAYRYLQFLPAPMAQWEERTSAVLDDLTVFLSTLTTHPDDEEKWLECLSLSAFPSISQIADLLTAALPLSTLATHLSQSFSLLHCRCLIEQQEEEARIGVSHAWEYFLKVQVLLLLWRSLGMTPGEAKIKLDHSGGNLYLRLSISGYNEALAERLNRLRLAMLRRGDAVQMLSQNLGESVEIILHNAIPAEWLAVRWNWSKAKETPFSQWTQALLLVADGIACYSLPIPSSTEKDEKTAEACVK